MSTNFIGLVIQPNEPLTLAIDEGIHFTMASLIDDAKPGRSTLKVRVRDQEFALCSLTFDEVEQQALDVYFKDVDEPTLILTGVNPINLTGNIMLEDGDFVPEEEDEEDDYGPIQFRDPSDERFLGGFELRHFGLEPHYSFYPDKIDLRKEESDEEDTMLHDNIAMGLINSMLNSGNEVKVKKAKAILETLKSKANDTSSQQNHGKISKKQTSIKSSSGSSKSQQQQSKKKDKKKKNKS
ncbi:hypothetical protein BDB00DRAFT_515453 [Zychaea mexicana]|uniref:uncharacterized protein n=1 Tax=Zychaea mexicana TaxID=64656 RepID=UPI0022FE290E|nr:uncharacterized protein BDB00DRAFT_515453 [Zychaea mexicana]KAI9491141.1 hypothetical protein BDB00DRAFT_515453 [Zychaea mexicana]